MQNKASVINCPNNLSSKIHKFLLRNIPSINIISLDVYLCINTVEFKHKLARKSNGMCLCLMDVGNGLKLWRSNLSRRIIWTKHFGCLGKTQGNYLIKIWKLDIYYFGFIPKIDLNLPKNQICWQYFETLFIKIYILL